MGDTVEALGYKADVPARVKDAVNDRVDTVKGTIGEVMDSVKQTVGGASEKMGKALGGARETARSGMSQAGERMGQVGEVRDRVTESMGQVRERIGSTMPSGEDVRGIASKVGTAIENPLGLVLGALALGFIAGMIIPVSDLEREKVGPLRDDLIERAQSISGDVVEHGRAVIAETAQATIAAAQQAAQQHGQQVLAGGLDPDTLVTNALEHGKQALRETTDVAMRTAQQSFEEHGKHVIGEARGTEQHSGGDTAPSAGMPSDASQGGGLRGGSKLEGGTGAQTPSDSGTTSSRYGVLLDKDRAPEA